MRRICCPTTIVTNFEVRHPRCVQTAIPLHFYYMVTNSRPMTYNITEEQIPPPQHSRNLKSWHFQRFPQLVYFKNTFTLAKLPKVCLILWLHSHNTHTWPLSVPNDAGCPHTHTGHFLLTFWLVTFTDNQQKNGEVVKICSNSSFPQCG